MKTERTELMLKLDDQCCAVFPLVVSFSWFLSVYCNKVYRIQQTQMRTECIWLYQDMPHDISWDYILVHFNLHISHTSFHLIILHPKKFLMKSSSGVGIFRPISDFIFSHIHRSFPLCFLNVRFSSHCQSFLLGLMTSSLSPELLRYSKH